MFANNINMNPTQHQQHQHYQHHHAHNPHHGLNHAPHNAPNHSLPHDLNASFTSFASSDGTEASYDSDAAFHIYNELQLPAAPPTPDATPIMNHAPPTHVGGGGPGGNVVYGFRTRHLSCIEENDSDSLHSSSLPQPYDMMKEADESFKRLQQAAEEDEDNEDDDDNDNDDDEVVSDSDEMPMLDESRLFDLDYFDELSVSKTEARHGEEAEVEDVEGGVPGAGADYWQSTVSEPLHRPAARGRGLLPPDIMTTSCYGTLNNSFGCDAPPPTFREAATYTPTSSSATPNYSSATPTYSSSATPIHTTPTKSRPQPPAQENVVYATPEKRREFNRSFDSSCNGGGADSQASSIYGGLEGAGGVAYGSMTSSLDLKYMTSSAMGSSATAMLMGRLGNSTPLDMSMVSSLGDGGSEEMGGSVGGGSGASVGGGSGGSVGGGSGGSVGGRGSGVLSGPCGPDDLNPEMATQCLTAAEHDLQSIRRLLEHETSGSVCPSCRISFDKGKRRKLIDTCGHERCYSCMFRNDQCPMCMNSSLKDVDCNNAQGYDTGIGGSTSTIVSPLGSPQPQLRSQVQRANAAALAKYMQHHRQESISPDYRYASFGKTPKAVVGSQQQQQQQHTHTVTVDVHHSSNNNNNSNNIHNGNNNNNNNLNVNHFNGNHMHSNNNSFNSNNNSFNHSNNNSFNHSNNNSFNSNHNNSFNSNNNFNHSNNNSFNSISNNNINSNNNNYSEINAAAFATPPTRRRFFNHQKLRSALTGHRRTASNGCPIDTASILSGGKETNPLETSTCSDSAVTRRRRKNVNNSVTNSNSSTSSAGAGGSENRLNRLSLAGTTVYAGHLSSLVFGKIKSLWNVNSSSTNSGLNQLAGSDHLSNDAVPSSSSINSSNSDKQKDQLRARLGLLLDTDPSTSGTNTTTSSSSTNISPEQTLSANVVGLQPMPSSAIGAVIAADNNNFGSQLSVATKDDTISLSGKFSKACSMTDGVGGGGGGYEAFPVKARKNPARRSARTGQLVGAGKRNGLYKPSAIAAAQPAVQLALKPLFFEVPLQEPDPPFVGRQWLLRELSNILMATETPGVLINGHPGTGKTALVLQLVEYSCFGRRKDAGASASSAGSVSIPEPDGIYCQINIGHDRLRALASHIVGYHFCQADSNLTCLVPDFVHSLAAQLCQAPQLAAYREYLINEPHLQDILSVKECIADAERVMRMAILEPLTILKRTGKITAKTCVILVDALCEAEYHRPDHGHTIATFLAKMTQYFPSWLKVVATVRTQMLEFVKGLSYTKMTLDSWASNDLLQKDMLDYITFRVNHSVDIQNNIAAIKDNNTGQLKFIGHLQALTKGSMLYAKLILDLIERGQLVIKSTSYKVLPVSLAQIFLLHFNLRFPTASSFEKASAILNVCLAALYPLTLNEIYYTISALKTDDSLTWDEFLQRFNLLDGFLIKRIDNTYMFFHPSFREWLIRRDEGESTKFLCDFRLGHAAIAFRLSRLQAPLDPEQTLELGHHMLKAHIYRNCQGPQSPRDMQSFWLASVTDNVSAALGSLRNVYNPNLKVSRLILLAGACPHHQTEFMGDATILCIAAHEGIVPMVSLLLEFGADVGRTNSQGCTPLILAAMRGHCDVVRLLVAAGSSLGQTDTTQRCALVHAARMGRLNVVKYLLACDWTPRTESNDVTLGAALQQALIGAAAQDHVTILEDLLEMDDIDVNAMEASSGDLALTAAARNGCADTVAVLLSRGARVDGRNKQGFTALWLAVKEGHWAVVEKLLQNGADVDEAVVPTLKTPLMIAAEEGHLDLVEMLLQRGAALEAQDHEGFTALSWAALRGRQAAARCLIERGCNRNHVDHNGRTALDLAAYQGSAALVQYLLDQGANLEHIDVNGMRPLDRSIACRNIQVVQVFLRRGAKLGPTTWSMAMGKPEILVVLLNKLLEDGNVLYRKNRFQEAAHRYQYALKKISNLETLLERSAVFAQLRANLLLNLSRCKRKLNELEESIDLASQAIAQKPSSYEGFYARAKARMENGQLNEALVDANDAMQKAVNSGVPPEVVEVLKRIQAELLTRITTSQQQQQQQNPYELYLEGGAAAGGVESQNEMTDL